MFPIILDRGVLRNSHDILSHTHTVLNTSSNTFVRRTSAAMGTKMVNGKINVPTQRRYNNNVSPRRVTGLICKTIIVNIRLCSRSAVNKSTYQRRAKHIFNAAIIELFVTRLGWRLFCYDFAAVKVGIELFLIFRVPYQNGTLMLRFY